MIKLFYDIHDSLSSIQRYNQIPQIKSESVAQHSYFVTLISRILVEKINEEYSNAINVQKAVDIAIMHDLDEMNSGDIIHSFKYCKGSDILRAEINKLNEQKITGLFSVLPNKQYFIDCYREEKKLMSIEAKIVKLADFISVVAWCNLECSLGNKKMSIIKNKANKKAQKLINEINNHFGKKILCL